MNWLNRSECNIHESDTAYTLELPAPGVKKEDIDIELSDNVVTLNARRYDYAEGRKRVGREYIPEEFQRRFRIGRDVDVDGIEASIHNGMLTITLPKQAKAEPKKIVVN